MIGVAARRAGRSRAASTASIACSITTSRMATPGRVRVAFGAPLRLRGEDYAALAAQVEARCERSDGR